jgi:peptidoglycan/LPS O-acetylase OafA/YrhL
MFENLLKKSVENNRLQSIDGWRAISILFVLIQHSAAKDGWPILLKNKAIDALGGVGVRFFFVISGFLITWLLIQEIYKYNTISIKSFYIRRVIRIIPVLLCFILICYFLEFFGVFQISRFDYLYTSTFMVDIFHTNAPFGHLWSLGVEEKFYLFWPVIFIYLFSKDMNKLIYFLAFIILLGPLLRAGIIFFNCSNYLIFNYHSFVIIYDGLALGCLGAIILTKYKNRITNYITGKLYLVVLVSILLIVLPLSFWIFPVLKIFQPLQDTIQCLGFLILLIASIINPEFLLFRILNISIVKHIGLISYSIYIWMGIVELSSDHLFFVNDYFTKFPGWIFSIIIISEISYYLIEQPIVNKKNQILKWFKV